MTNTTSEDNQEDKAYSKQFFTIGRLGHTPLTAEFGSPTLVWHVAFWPKHHDDPFSISMMTGGGKIKGDDLIIDEFGKAHEKVIEDFNRFLHRLQARGRHPDAPDQAKPSFVLREPGDWESDTTRAFKVFEWESAGFTVWWPDHPSANPDGVTPDDLPKDDLPKNLISELSAERPKAAPIRTDLRVRVLAEASIDYSSVTFFIDAGKPWNDLPIYLTRDGVIPGDIGERRQTIFKHVKNIKTICEERLEAVDHEDKRLIDLDLLPEPDPICGTSSVALEHGFTDCAEALEAAADYLYDSVWTDFCNDFGFDIDTIAGKTDEVFANFRGLVTATCGTTEQGGKLVREPEPKQPSDAAHPGSRTFPRFDGGGEGFGTDMVEPNAVVKAYMPFMRRFCAEGDWRNWIACGIYDWRAIYINPVSAQSEFAAFDEWHHDSVERRPSAIPAGHLPERRSNQGTAGSDAPTTERNDKPAPIPFLLLTKFDPDRRQVGRMAERIHSLGTRRLFAFRDWSVIRNGSIWINHYGRQLDDAFGEWIRKADALTNAADIDLALLDEKFWASIRAKIDAVGSPDVEKIRSVYETDPRQACVELRELAMNHRQTMDDPWDKLLIAVDDSEKVYRKISGNRDRKLAEINAFAGQELIKITKGLDTISEGTVGGIGYRLARSRYYAQTFQDAREYLRVGNIETWLSYEQVARRGIEPVLRFITGVSERLEKMRTRLQTLKQDILQRSIALQTEATRDNTHRLEQIQSEIRRMANSTAGLEKEAAGLRTQLAKLNLFGRRIDLVMIQIPAWIAAAAGLGVVVWNYFSK
jgi:hypothetical protein